MDDICVPLPFVLLLGLRCRTALCIGLGLPGLAPTHAGSCLVLLAREV